jgi:LuxR family transcriptional regulator, maltose regulon positive regulatory protein
MPTPTNHTKVSPPRVPGVLYRSRLIEQITKNQDKRLLFILGQAAQGKSTLAASYAATQEVPVAWLNLDQGDSDPVNLFYWLVNAFQHIMPERDFSFLKSYPSSSQGPRELISLYREWVQVMFEQINDPVQLVIDGLDRLAPKAPSFLFLHTLSNEAPPHLRLIMLSREEPPFGLQELKIKQQAQVLTNEDLAFSLEETRAFFRETRKMGLNSSQVARIHAAAEGWVGGLLLFSEAIQRLPEGERERYISEKIPDHLRMEAFRFFEEAILSSQPPEIREFLIKSSVLDKMETEFIRDLLGTKDIEEVLQEAARKHLFVQSNYEEGKGWVFRYHQLFRDFLLLKFNTELSSETRQSLFLKTGLLFQQRGRLEEAVRYFLQAGAYESAVPAIEKTGGNLVRSRRTDDLREWLQALPEETVQGNPWLLYYLSRTRGLTDPVKNLPILHRALTLFEQGGDLRGRLASLIYLIATSMYLGGKEPVPLPVLLAKGEDLLNKVGLDLYPSERANLWMQIGYGLFYLNPRKADQACQNAYIIAREMKSPILQLTALIRRFDISVVLTEISLADEISQEVEKLLGKHPLDHETELDYHTWRGVLFMFKGELKKAEAKYEFVRKECERLGLSYFFVVCMVEYIILKINLGQYREAEELGQYMLQLAAAQGQIRQTGAILQNLGRKCNFEGDFKKGKECVQQWLELLPAIGSASPWFHHRLGILRGSLWSPGEEDEAMIRDLQKAVDYFSNFSNGHTVDAHFVMALISWQKKDRNKTVRHLHSGLKLARERGIAYLPYLSPREISRVCALGLELGDQEDSDYALKILSTRRPPQAEAELERLMDHPDSKIRARAVKIGFALHRSTLPRLKIETLGGFRVLRSGSPVKEEEWHGSQAKNLLKAIVAYGGEGVRQEVLMESLWPEGQPAKVEKNFKSALHRLRQVLEPDMDKKYGYFYIRVKDSRVSLDQEICEVDVNRFLALLKEGEKKEGSQQLEEALSTYQEAADRYSGDFLPDDDVNELTDSRREELRRKYLGLLLRTARIHEERGALRKAISSYEKAVEFDPFSEEANRRLMALYTGLGKHDEAINIYKSYQKILREKLDAEPDTLTKAFYKKIQNP